MMKDFLKKRFKLFSVLLICLFLASVTPAYPQTSQQITNGLSWLASNQSLDGSWVENITTSYHSTAAVVESLNSIGSKDLMYTNGINWIVAQQADNVRYLSLKIISLAPSGNDISSDINSLLSYQNSDGGFGEYIGGTSGVSHTFLSLLALKAANYSDQTVINNAINYLLSSQNTDGGFGVLKGSPSEVYYTSLVMQALSTQSQTVSIANATNRAINFLIAHQKADGSFGSIFETAHAYIALAAVTTDQTVLGNAIGYITKAQLPDGSWYQDTYSTALALRALFISQNRPAPPPAPTTGTITGTVIDGGTNQPLSGVMVSLMSNPGIGTTTTGTGSFSLANVPQGPQQISLSLVGYTTSLVTVDILAGSITNIGAKALLVNLTTGIIQGTVTDAQNASPLAGVTITVTGTQTLTATTAADGSYKITDINPGTVTLSAGKTGYSTLSGTGAIVAGGILIFSPSLSTTKPTSTTGDLKGTIQDRTSGQPISGASVSVLKDGTTPITTTASGPTGIFSIFSLSPGSYSVFITASGYTGQSYMVSIFAGITSDLGLVRLDPVLTSTTITGKVTDAVSGSPIANANVLIPETNLSAKTGQDGAYTISGITQLSFSLLASATGYNSKTLSITTASYGVYKADLTLSPSQTGDIRITALTTDKISYPANTDVTITATIENRGPASYEVVISAQIKDPKGEVLAMAKTSVSRLIIAPLSSATAGITWNTGQLAAGSYTAHVQITDTTGTILADREVIFSIEPSIGIANSTIGITPRTTHLGATETVILALAFTNRSNTRVTLTIEHEIKSPSGAIINSSSTLFLLTPDMTSASTTLATFSYSFTESGEYPIIAKVLNGTELLATANSTISVAPAVRIDPGKTLTPQTVVPDGDKRIRINIHLEGVEQKP